MLHASSLTAAQDDRTTRWHDPDAEAVSLEATPTDLADLIQLQHRANFELWHEEDLARDPEAPDSTIARVKHAIDRLNQRRNDLVERIDTHLLEGLQPVFAEHPNAPLHSETPGMMIDRLSILALKIFHTREESERTTATEEHRARNRRRLALLLEQRQDLSNALEQLQREMAAGKRRFKLYRQMKMYNDPELNPAIYQHHAPAQQEPRK